MVGVHDVVHDKFQPLIGVDVPFFGHGKEGIGYGRPFSGFMRPSEQVVFPSKCQWPEGVLGQVVFDLQVAVQQLVVQFLPPVHGIENGPAYGTLQEQVW